MSGTTVISRVVLLVFLVVFSPLSGRSEAMELIALGSWSSLVIGASASNGRGIRESDPSIVSLGIINTRDQYALWNLEAKIVEGAQIPEGIQIWIRRTGNGMGTGWVRGGTSYQLLDPSGATLFTGAGDRSHITLQLKITGITPETPKGVYAPHIAFTVVDL
ncbi:MAG: hypothetical protein WCR88_09980 [Aminobacterium sp.]|jgi:hypothetical protein|uniref:hypothetical protein n=1 Tax=unclassified Aminobacterium TaxID=2685012 RepID=UPI001BCF4E4D|nr:MULTISPECIES: hypothetical protein [unclassified Aminobacterium]MDD2207650.1 hypothetical protein [Aminobacterium sp.]MDD3425246.1 hypothetical protein [Aminobacterium sp.]MDD3708360.1 hypothetical protein [Aminobacterium sp.]MDD4229693.1 hypothetical protein [Aminobacterium sp.]MDD4552493.1 hypothetical protein [Aminobacterium sp.]